MGKKRILINLTRSVAKKGSKDDDFMNYIKPNSSKKYMEYWRNCQSFKWEDDAGDRSGNPIPGSKFS